MKAASTLILVVVAVTASGCLDLGARAAPQAQSTGGQGLVVRRGDFAESVLLTGEVEAEEAEILTAPNVNIWPLTLRFVSEEGAAVSKGEVVVEFDNSQLFSNIEDMRTQAIEASNLLVSERSRVAAEVAEASFKVEQRRAEVEKAELAAWVPAEILSEREYAEAQLALRRAHLGLEEAELALEAAREAGQADVRIQQIALDTARDAASRAEASIEKLSLRAPRDGIVVRGTNPREGRPIRAGDTVWPGLSVAQLPDLDSLFVKARLFDVDDGCVSVGQKVHATLDAFPKLELEGSIRAVSAVAAEAGAFSARRYFDVTIDLDEIDPVRMRPGMSVKLVVEGELIQNALLVPREALVFSSELTKAAEATGELVEVEVGPCNARFCVVRDGLDEGSKLGRVTTRSGPG